MWGGPWIKKMDSFGIWVLLVLMLLFMITGFGMTRRIMDPVLARYLHGTILPLPLFVLLLIHVLVPINKEIKNWGIFRSEKTIDIYTYVITLTGFAVFVWLYFR